MKSRGKAMDWQRALKIVITDEKANLSGDSIQSCFQETEQEHKRPVQRSNCFFFRGYQPTSDLVKDENGDLLADSDNIECTQGQLY
jgi:hypothetical protein